MAAVQVTGKYAELKRAIYKDTMGRKYDPAYFEWRGSQKFSYKTEQGFRNAMKKKFEKEIAQVDAIEHAEYPLSGTISVWYPNNSYQARGTMSYRDANGYHSEQAGPTGGWGYDKYSTVSASLLNAALGFRKLLLDARARGKTLPYGVSLNKGKPFLPHWDGGVGFECHVEVLKALGYDVKWVRTGMPNSYVIDFTLKRKKK